MQDLISFAFLNFFFSEWSECGTGCAAMIAVVSLVVTGLIVSATLLVFKRRGRNSKGHDFPSVTTPLNPTVTTRTEATTVSVYIILYSTI